MRSKKEARMLEAAIDLFAESGYAATARDIAKRGRTTTMTLYRGFRKGKESVFEDALNRVIEVSFDPGKFMLCIFEDQKSQDFAAVLHSGLLRWYKAIRSVDARLLAQALICDQQEWRATADSALERIVSVLATTIERQLPQNGKPEFDAPTAAKLLISLLFHAKWTWAAKGQSTKAEKEETKAVEALLRYGLAGVAAALKE